MDIPTSFIIIILIILAFFIGKILGKLIEKKNIDKRIEEERKDAIKKSRAVLGGQFAENLAPYLPDFPYHPSECKFLGRPIDFIVFKGLDKQQTEEVIFLEIKTGKAKLSPTEKHLKEAIINKNVKWEEYRVDESITKGSQ